MAFLVTAFRYNRKGDVLHIPMHVPGDEDDVEKMLKRMEGWNGFFLARIENLGEDVALVKKVTSSR